MLDDACIENLQMLKGILQRLDDTQYDAPLEVLSNSTIGQHVRHVLEFYLCLLNSMESGTVNYDTRQRDLALQSHVQSGIHTIEHIIHRLNSTRVNLPLTLKGDHGIESPAPFSVDSNVQRELAFNLEHAIHHQALIKIGLNQLGQHMQSGFGVAPSTLRSVATVQALEHAQVPLND